MTTSKKVATFWCEKVMIGGAWRLDMDTKPTTHQAVAEALLHEFEMPAAELTAQHHQPLA